jgi:hypothetical protein
MEKNDFSEELYRMKINKLAEDADYIEIQNIIEERTEYENSLNENIVKRENIHEKFINENSIVPSLTEEQKEKKNEDYILELLKKYSRGGILKYLNVEMNNYVKYGEKGTIRYIIEKTNTNELKMTLVPKYREKIIFTI